MTATVEGESSALEPSDSFLVFVSYKGQHYPVPVHPFSPVDSILDFIEEVSPFEREYVKLVCKGKRLEEGVPVRRYGLAADSKLMMIASSAAEVEQIRTARADPLVKGFADEARDEKRRRKRAKQLAQSDWGTDQHAEYKFTRFETLMKYTSPTPFDAEKLLRRFATDPGIVEIMTKRCWQVGTLCEMDPIDDDEQKRRRAEDPNVDVLGWNQNFGQRIALRIRTDDLKGFRTYNSVINTLLHELAHNVFGPHDQNFWNLYAELKKQYMDFHSFWSQNGKKTGTQMGEFDSDESDVEITSFVLGGDRTALSASEAAARAAERRFGEIAESHAASCSCGCRTSAASSSAAPSASLPTHPDAAASGSCDEKAVIDSPSVKVTESISTPSTSDSVHTVSEAPNVADCRSSAHGSEPATAAVPTAPTMDESLNVDLDAMEAMGMDGCAAYLRKLRLHLLEITPLSKGAAGHAALQVLRKLVNNLVENPGNSAYRVVKLDNAVVARTLMPLPPALAALRQMGFAEHEKRLVMEDGRFDVVRLRLGRDLIDAAMLRV